MCPAEGSGTWIWRPEAACESASSRIRIVAQLLPNPEPLRNPKP
jgi:hypothetical protein